MYVHDMYNVYLFLLFAQSFGFILTDFTAGMLRQRGGKKNRHFFLNIYQAAETTDMPKSCK